MHVVVSMVVSCSCDRMQAIRTIAIVLPRVLPHIRLLLLYSTSGSAVLLCLGLPGLLAGEERERERGGERGREIEREREGEREREKEREREREKEGGRERERKERERGRKREREREREN